MMITPFVHSHMLNIYGRTCIHSQTHPVGPMQALPASRIGDIVQTSSMSNDEIENLIDQLLDKMDSNAEVSACFLPFSLLY